MLLNLSCFKCEKKFESFNRTICNYSPFGWFVLIMGGSFKPKAISLECNFCQNLVVFKDKKVIAELMMILDELK